MICIVPTTSTEHIAKKLEKQSGVKVLFANKNRENKRYFPDGEVYVSFSNINPNDRFVVLHSGMPNPNTGLVELEMILEFFKQKKISPEIFFTYFPYARQDKIFEEGEINMARRLIDKLINYYNVSQIYGIDIHFYGAKWLENYPLTNLSAVELLKTEAEKIYNNIVYVGPDKSAYIRTGMPYMTKQRQDSFSVKLNSDNQFKELVKGRIVGVVDDMITTGGTLERFYNECMGLGVEKVIALVTHGVLVSGIEKIQSMYSDVFLTNTIYRPQTRVDVSDFVIKSLLKSLKIG